MAILIAHAPDVMVFTRDDQHNVIDMPLVAAPQLTAYPAERTDLVYECAKVKPAAQTM